ncbi:MAG: HPF/RaiA family ribosome-associated protein [bacterium]
MKLKIDLQGKYIPGNLALHEHVLRSISFSLGRFENRIDWVKVRLKDLNGPKGGRDKNCTIQIKTAFSKEIFIEEIDSDLYAVVDLATKRAGSAIRREIEKKNDWRMRPSQKKFLKFAPLY